jgi:hypothetical protein
MIKLDVKPYCHDCRAFEAEVEGPEVLLDCFGNEALVTDTYVRCKKRRSCEAICKYLKENKNDQT